VKPYDLATIAAGALAVAALAFAASLRSGPALIAGLEQAAAKARDEAGGKGIDMLFRTSNGWLTRHPGLTGGSALSPDVRAQAAAAIAAVPGIGGVSWRAGAGSNGGTQIASGARVRQASLHCQQDVEAILRVRTIRFAEASAQIDAASDAVLNEVAAALRPCLGGIIEITGHTDGSGDEMANLALSRARAEAVRFALIGRDIPADGLRANGLGSTVPMKGLAASDPANRRIEFSVIAKMPLAPRPIDTPGPG
jgi:OmpA-OmpF porin, OOP family